MISFGKIPLGVTRSRVTKSYPCTKVRDALACLLLLACLWSAHVLRAEPARIRGVIEGYVERTDLVYTGVPGPGGKLYRKLQVSGSYLHRTYTPVKSQYYITWSGTDEFAKASGARISTSVVGYYDDPDGGNCTVVAPVAVGGPFAPAKRFLETSSNTFLIKGDNTCHEEYTPPVFGGDGHTDYYVDNLSQLFSDEDTYQDAFDRGIKSRAAGRFSGKFTTFVAQCHYRVYSPEFAGTTVQVDATLRSTPLTGGATVTSTKKLSVALNSQGYSPYLQLEIINGYNVSIDAEVWVEGNRCQACTSGCAIGTMGEPEPGCLDWLVPLGQNTNGDSWGALRLFSSSITASLAQPASLQFLESVVRPERIGSSSHRQFKTDTVLADVDNLSGGGFTLKFYYVNHLGAKDTNGFYTFTGGPYVTWKIENPSSTDPAETKIKITRDYAGGSRVWNFAETTGLPNGARRITTVYGSGLKTVVQTVTPDAEDPAFEISVKEVKGSNGVVVTKTEEHFYNYSWAKLRLKEVRDPDGAALATSWNYDTWDKLGTLLEQWNPDGSYVTFGADGSTITRDGSGNEIKRTRVLVARGNFDGDTISDLMIATGHISAAEGKRRSYRREYSEPLTISGQKFRRVRIEETPVYGDDSKQENGALTTEWGNVLNRVTQERFHFDGPHKDQLAWRLGYDGILETATFSIDSGTGRKTTVASRGEPDVTKETVIRGLRTTTVINPNGTLVSSKVEDIVSGLKLSEEIVTTTDSAGRPTQIQYLDGSTEVRAYSSCCGLLESVTRRGVTTEYAYDALGRQTSVTADGLTTLTAYDADGRVLSRERRGTDSSTIVLETHVYDLAGRLTSSTDALSRTTLQAVTYVDGATVQTTTYPGGGTKIETTNPDGTRRSQTGTAVPPLAWTYETTETETGWFSITTEFKGLSDPASDEWTKSYSDMFGQTVRVTYPDAAAIALEYNALGQLVKQTDPDGVVTLRAYDALGELETEAIDMNGNGVIDFAGLDRITKTTSLVATKTESSVNYTVQRLTTEVWEVDSANTPTTVSIAERSADGLRSWQTIRGLTTKSVTVFDGLGGRTVTTTAPDGSKTVQSFFGERLTVTTVKTLADVQLYSATQTYDSHGRMSSQVDARNGATTFTYYADDKLHTVTTADPDTTQSGTGYDAQVTTYAYDSAGRVFTVTHPDGGVVNTTYWPTGAVKRTWGTRTYPTEYTYDAQGRVKTLTTWQNFAGDTGKAVTTWIYDAQRGWLTGKQYHDGAGPTYTYKPSGRLHTRVWARTPTITTTYGYSAAGDLSGTDYSDATPDVTLTFDRAGRVKNAVDGFGSRALAYHANGRLEDESYTAGALNGFSIDRSFDSFRRLSGLAVNTPALATLGATTYAYDTASRLETVTTGTNTATYAYHTNSPLVSTLTFKNGGTTRMTTAKQYDKLNRLTSIASTPSAGSPFSYDYTYNAANQRTRVTREDNAYWSYGYDTLGQVTSGKKFTASSAAVPGHDYAWTFDDIGNRKTAVANGATAAYTASLLNQYTQQTAPGTIDVLGAASSTATVTVAVNSGTPQATTRQGELFYKQVSVNNASSAQNPALKITAVQNLAGPSQEDVIAEINKTAYVPQTPETYTHDADGNLTADARWTYTWDGENRLIAVETGAVALTAGVVKKKLEFLYDEQGRRVTKRVYDWDNSTTTYVLTAHLAFVYDGWNLLAELDVLAARTPTRTYAWGLDLSGTFQGAGGVGGLLHATEVSIGTSHFAIFDGNGNVAGFTKHSDGTLSAKYDYKVFGETLSKDGAFSTNNTFRFSGKYLDDETGFIYYGFRYYQPSSGRWLSRDPLEEGDGPNMYASVRNYPTGSIDPFGRQVWIPSGRPGDTIPFPVYPPYPGPINMGPRINFDWSAFVEEFLLTQNSAKLELGGEFLIPTPPPFVAMISFGGAYRQFQCIDRNTKKVREGFEASPEISLEGGVGAGYTLKRQGRQPPPGLGSAGRRAFRRNSRDPLPWYKQRSPISAAASMQSDSGTDGNCFCPDAKVAFIVSIFAQGRATAAVVGGSLKGSMEWDVGTPFKWENFDGKIESTLGFRIGLEASLTIGGQGKGSWIGYFYNYVK